MLSSCWPSFSLTARKPSPFNISVVLSGLPPSTDQQEIKILAVGIVVQALDVRRLADVALDVTVASRMRHLVALLVKSLRITILRHQALACHNVVGPSVERGVPRVIARHLHLVLALLLHHVLPFTLK